LKAVDFGMCLSAYNSRILHLVIRISVAPILEICETCVLLILMVGN